MNIATTTERVDAPTPLEGVRADRAQASFAAALRDLEQSSAAMLAMPHVAGRPQEPPPAQREPGLAASGLVSGHANAELGHVAARESVRASHDVRSTVRDPGHGRTTLDAGVPADVEAAAAWPVRAGERLSIAAPDVVPAMSVVPATGEGDAAGSSERSALARESMQGLHFASQTVQHAPVVSLQPAAKLELAAAASVNDSAAARFSLPPDPRAASAALAPAQVIARLAPDGVAVAVRAALLEADVERELLVRLAAELGASGIGRYSIQLNGLCVARPAEKGGQ
jgi:hypothetical protein